jgi:hypothetical protein
MKKPTNVICEALWISVGDFRRAIWSLKVQENGCEFQFDRLFVTLRIGIESARFGKEESELMKRLSMKAEMSLTDEVHRILPFDFPVGLQNSQISENERNQNQCGFQFDRVFVNIPIGFQ